MSSPEDPTTGAAGAAARATTPGIAPGAPATTPGPDVDHDLPLDAHLHTSLSHDSDVPIDVYCALAVERGIREIAITDHVDFDPRAPDHAFASFATRERQVRDAAARWADRGLRVLLGIEVTYESHYETEIRDHLARHPYDFTIGSVHVAASSPYVDDRVAGWVAGRSFDEIVAPYFAEVEAASRSELFDTIGHLDYVKKYLVGHVPPSAFAARPDVYEPLLRALVETGTGLEVNASGLRHGPGETYPPPWAVARFRELGGTIVTAGSDAHAASQFAFGLARAYEIAAAAGFEELAIRRAPGVPRAVERVTIPGRLRGPRMETARAAGAPGAVRPTTPP